MNGRTKALRVALLLHEGAQPESHSMLDQLASGLVEAGHEPFVIRTRRLPETLLAKRGFTRPIAQIPLTVRSLWGGEFDIAQAMSVPDVAAALAWRRIASRPVVFGCAEALGRDQLADSRLRLPLLSKAITRSDAVIAATREVRGALKRWLACDATVIEPGNAAAHARLYDALIAQT